MTAETVPAIDFVKIFVGLRPVSDLDVFVDPVHEMVLKCALDELMEEIR